MKNTVVFYFCSLLVTATQAQTPDKRWNVGLHGGLTQYHGELGHDFYRLNQPAYFHAGLSVSRYLSPHVDAAVFVTRGDLGHSSGVVEDNNGRTSFISRVNTANFMMRYNFFDPERMLRPFLFIGSGVIRQKGLGSDYAGKNSFALSIPSAGAGLNLRITPVINLQLQEMLIHTSADDIDFTESGINDLYLYHSLGVTFNFGGGQGAGGRDVDGCYKIKSTPKTHENSSKAEKKSRKSPKAGRKAKKIKG